MKKITFFFLLAIMLPQFACNKQRKANCEGKLEMHYEFDFPITISPSVDTVVFGDTLWVEIKLDNPILNKLNNKTYDVTKANFYLFFYIVNLMQPNAYDIGNYISLDENGNPLSNTNPDGDIYSEIRFKSDGLGHLFWKRGFIIRDRGIYSLLFTNQLFYRSSLPHITACSREKVKLFHTFNGENTAASKNYNLLQYSLDSNVRSWSSEQFAASSQYVICVN